MHNAVMCTLCLYEVIRITRHLHIKLKSFSNIAQPLHKETLPGCSFLYIIVKKSVIMSEAFIHIFQLNDTIAQEAMTSMACDLPDSEPETVSNNFYSSGINFLHVRNFYDFLL